MANEYNVNCNISFEVSWARLDESGEYEQVPQEFAEVMILDTPGHRFITEVAPERAAWWRYLKAECAIMANRVAQPSVVEPPLFLDYDKEVAQ